MNAFRRRSASEHFALRVVKEGYYDPHAGRFLNADGLVSTGQGLLGYNMYAYCNNNPIMGYDPTGTSPISPQIARSNIDSSTSYARRGVRYDVPLYKQGWTNLCWAYVQLMVESSREKIQYTDFEARVLAMLMSCKTYNPDEHKNPFNHLGWPDCKVTGIKIDSIISLYYLLLENGPLYATYVNQYGYYHVIVVTGVDVNNDIVYTNNSHGKCGEQTFDEFLNGVCRPWYKSLVFDYTLVDVNIPA